MLLKITSVDMDGYAGREYHPQPTDVGQVGLVVGCETWYLAENGDIQTLVDDARLLEDDNARQAAIAAIEERDPSTISMWTIVLKDGRTVNMMDHEVGLFRA